MSTQPRSLSIRLGEFRPVVDAVELTKGLRGKIVGGKKRLAQMVPAEGGMTIEMFGSSTFVPVATGTLSHTQRVDADLLSGFLRNSTRAFHPAEIVSLEVTPEQLIARCGTLRVTLQLGTALSSPRTKDPPTVAPAASEVRAPKPEKGTARTEDIERPPNPPKGPPHAVEADQDNAPETGPTEADLLQHEAECELSRVEEIERKLQSSKRRRPDYNGVKFFLLGLLTLIAISELVFGGDTVAWLVVVCACAACAEAWTDLKAQREWERERRKEKDQIAASLKRIETLGFSARQEPAYWVLKPRSKKNSQDA